MMDLLRSLVGFFYLNTCNCASLPRTVLHLRWATCNTRGALAGSTEEMQGCGCFANHMLVNNMKGFCVCKLKLLLNEKNHFYTNAAAAGSNQTIHLQTNIPVLLSNDSLLHPIVFPLQFNKSCYFLLFFTAFIISFGQACADFFWGQGLLVHSSPSSTVC